MTENLATPRRDGLAPSILAPPTRMRVPVWLLVIAVVAAFALGWAASSLIPAGGVVPGAAPADAPAPTEAEEEDTEDDSGFVRVATRDLDDFGDDLDDLDITLDEDGFWRLYTNVVELNFNVTQLKQHESPASIEKPWTAGLDQLDDDIDAIESGITAGSDTKVRSAVADARETIEGLADVVSQVD